MKANFLASPSLVVAYALAGTVDIDLDKEPLRRRTPSAPSISRICHTQAEIAETIATSLNVGMFEDRYASVFEGSEMWRMSKMLRW